MTAAADNLALLARAGYAARGIIYVVVGGLAALAAWGSGGQTTDSKGALTQLLGAPFGKLLLALVAVGLLCYAAWRAAQALLDADHHGLDAKGLAVRAGLGISAVLHLGLAVFAVSLVIGQSGGSGSGDQSSQEWTAWLMSQPFGRWLVMAVGVALCGAGFAHFVKALRARFALRFDMSADQRRVIIPVSRLGLAARGVVFLIIGGFVLLAAIQQDPGEARGLSGALRALQDQPYGWLLLALVAVGLMMFGAYSFIESAYRRIQVPSELS
jgi:hypothetical protein